MINKLKEAVEKLKSDDFIGEVLAQEIFEQYPEIKEHFYEDYNKLDYSEKNYLIRMFSFLGKDNKLVEFSFRILDEEENSNLKASIITLIGDISDVESIPRLAKYLKDPERRVRANTVEALSKIGDRRIIDLLLPVIDEEKDNRVLANTAIALWKFEDIRGKVKDIFAKMIDDKEKWMRASALYAFGETQIDDFAEHLLSSLEDEDEDICRNAIIALIGYSEILTKNK